ncbi:MAG: hypothetical protein AAGA92_00225 [Planctomycetota bacterium]
MESAQPFGLILIAVSAALLAVQWHADGADPWATVRKLNPFRISQLKRRTLASSMIGLLGFALAMAGEVPRTPWAISCYLAGLASGACLILCLGIADVVSTTRARNRETLDRLARELQNAQLREARSGSGGDRDSP